MTTSEHTGRIFDVRRFSTHDGGGIRTTVFFKGCPLRCAWCHNPEGIDFVRWPLWFAGKCIGCGSCAETARFGGVRRMETGIAVDPAAEEDWDAVLDACPTGALRWDSRDVRVDELMELIRRDAPFYAHGGGGATLSGGDPLMQAEFARELLLRCREEDVHTAIETELHAPEEAVQAVLPLVDLIYADLKLLDGGLHRHWTGVGNERILSNLEALLTGPLSERLILRTPLIPGITATEENLRAIAAWLARRNPAVRWELLNYNPLAAAKYPLVGREYSLPPKLPRFSAEQMEAFAELTRSAGAKNVFYE
ncbi:MAG: glycyl-radical enzyme activating protein [Aristaeellaceae bacterium]